MEIKNLQDLVRISELLQDTNALLRQVQSMYLDLKREHEELKEKMVSLQESDEKLKDDLKLISQKLDKLSGNSNHKQNNPRPKTISSVQKQTEHLKLENQINASTLKDEKEKLASKKEKKTK